MEAEKEWAPGFIRSGNRAPGGHILGLVSQILLVPRKNSTDEGPQATELMLYN